MGLDVKRMTNRDRGFYRLMGPLLARREIEKDMGDTIYDDDNKIWYIAIERGHVIGFCAAMPHNNVITFLSDYVLPEHRWRGVYRELWQARAAEFPDGPARAVCTAASWPTYKKGGFRHVRDKSKRYMEVRRD